MGGGTIWITGIPGSGKSTLARLSAEIIRARGGRAEVIDGDEARRTISKGLGFSREDRAENVRRIAWAARLAGRAGAWAVVAAASPYASDRDDARTESKAEGLPFIQAFARCPSATAESRDPGGLYARARAGAITGLTGLDGPYEEPKNPDIVLDTDRDPPDDCARRIVQTAIWRPDENPPIVCFGRGSSGTRFASMLLQDLGVFVGTHKNVNGCDDSMDWVDLVYRMVKETSGMEELPVGSQYREEILDTARGILFKSAVPPGTPWGWKLPETTLLLPLFDDAFPRARFVHLVRHPVSVCIRKTHITSNPFDEVGRDALPGAYAYAGRPADRMEEDADWVRNALSWTHQVERAISYGRDILGPKRYIELRFEDVADDPDHALCRLETFLGLARARRKPSMLYDPKRVEKIEKNDPRIGKVMGICGETAIRLGYDMYDFTTAK